MPFRIKTFTRLTTLSLKAKEDLNQFTNISRIAINKAVRRILDKGYYPVDKVKLIPTKRNNIYQIRIKAKYVGRKNAKRLFKNNQGGLRA